nr:MULTISPECIES: hypothetical protein [unclassified Paenibacillus]
MHRQRMLIAGDALIIHDGRLCGPDNNVDDLLARKSIAADEIPPKGSYRLPVKSSKACRESP